MYLSVPTAWPLSFTCCLLGQPVSGRGLFRLLAGPCPTPTPVAGGYSMSTTLT